MDSWRLQSSSEILIPFTKTYQHNKAYILFQELGRHVRRQGLLQYHQQVRLKIFRSSSLLEFYTEA